MRTTQYGFGDYQTFGSTSNHPNSPDYDADAMAARDDIHYAEITSKLLDEGYDVQEEVGKDMAKSDPTWFGEIASIVCLTEQAEENGNLAEANELKERLFKLCAQLTGYTIAACAKSRTDAEN